jgi:hypothetical protein
MAPGSVRLDGYVQDSVLLDLSFYNASIELEAPAHCSITNLVGRIFVSGVIDVVTPPALPDSRFLALTMFLPSSVIPEGGTEEHINDTLRDCGISLSAADLLRFLGHVIDEALAAMLAVEGYLQLHGNPIVVNPRSTAPFEPQEIDVRVVNEVDPDPAREQDALALLITTLGHRGDPTRFGSASFLGLGQAGALAIGNFFFLRHVVRPLIIATLAPELDMSTAEVASHFDPGHPCHLSRALRQTRTFDELGITSFNGDVRIDIDSLSVDPSDHGYFIVHAAVNADFRFRIARRWVNVGRTNGTLDGELHLDLIGDLIQPRLVRGLDVRATVDRRARITAATILFALGRLDLLAVFEASVSSLRTWLRTSVRALLSAMLDSLEASLPAIDVHPLFAWLEPYGFAFTPTEVIIDDILVSGELPRHRRMVRPAHEGSAVLPTGWGFDLDRDESREAGTVDPEVVLDFDWDRFGGKKCIVTANGAEIAYLGSRLSFTDLNRDDLERLHYVQDHTIFEEMLPIVPDDQPLDVQGHASVFAMKTSTSTGHWRYAKVQVHPMHQSDTDLTFNFAVYD